MQIPIDSQVQVLLWVAEIYDQRDDSKEMAIGLRSAADAIERGLIELGVGWTWPDTEEERDRRYLAKGLCTRAEYDEWHSGKEIQRLIDGATSP